MNRAGDLTVLPHVVPVTFSDGRTVFGNAVGGTVTWQCRCQSTLPLFGAAPHWHGDTALTRCTMCRRSFRVLSDDRRHAVAVIEEGINRMAIV